MEISYAQKDVRSAYANGFMGQLISGFLWLGSAALATRDSQRLAILVLVFGGMLIFPLTQLGLRMIGKRGRLEPGNPLNNLGMQIAFVLPLSLPVVFGATMYKAHWFFPGFMILVGAHYLPFIFLYGMRSFAVLCGLLVSGGLLIGLYWQDSYSAAGWITGGILLMFSLLGFIGSRKEK